MPDFLLEPERTALINVDMQNCFVEGSPARRRRTARGASSTRERAGPESAESRGAVIHTRE